MSHRGGAREPGWGGGQHGDGVGRTDFGNEGRGTIWRFL